jgi:CRP/FNR family transcriptional regulator, nitrogen oxide reductase regulator
MPNSGDGSSSDLPRRTTGKVRFGMVHGKGDSWALEDPGCELFEGLTPSERALVLSSARKRMFYRGDPLRRDGENLYEVHLLLDGAVKIMQFTVKGDAVIFGLGLPGELLCPGGFFPSRNYSSTVLALQTTRALVWTSNNFKGILDTCPTLFRNYVQIQHRYVLEMEQRFCEMATKSVSQILASLLVRLDSRIGGPATLRQINVSRAELAQMAGTTMYTASRTLASWEAQGLVSSHSKYVMVCDVKSLRALS